MMNEQKTLTPLQQSLIDLGYKKHVANYYEVFHKTDTLFQKKVKDEKGTLYFINVWWYDRERYNIVELKEDIQIEVQFWKDGDAFMGVVLFERDIDKVEEHLYHMWNTLSLGYYEEYDYDCS